MPVQRGSFGAAVVLCVLFCAAPVQANGSEGGISEIRIGVLAHDEGMFAGQKEEGIDVNAEIRFPDLGWLEDVSWMGAGWRLEPHLGASINTTGDTNKVYVGLTVVKPFWEWAFVEFGAGGAGHDGETRTTDPDKKEFGCRILFHLSLGAGVMVSEHVSVSAYLDHISNANLCDANEALETAGVRVGFRF